MRSVFIAFSFLLAVVAGCGVDRPRPEAAQLDPLGGAAPAGLKCPTICGDGTMCQLPNGTCTEVCNACFCTTRGGKVVSSCGALAPTPEASETEAASSPSSSSAADSVERFGACGNTVCGKGSFCCNASCNTCAPIGGVCTEQICNPQV